jgi:hypothetical protein
MPFVDHATRQKLRLFLFMDIPLVHQRLKRLLHTAPSFGNDQIDVPLRERSAKTIAQLIAKSHERPMDLETVIPWSIGVDRTRWPKQPDQLWIYGTSFYDQLTQAQRLETAWLEIARDISMFVYLEEMLPPLYIGYVNRYGNKLPPLVREYLMVFSKEEIVHTQMFRRYMTMAGLPYFAPSVPFAKLGELLPNMHPCVGTLATLVIEWMAECGAMHATQSEEVDPLTRDLFKQHHFDEVRHIAFACRVVEDYFESGPEKEIRQVRRMFRQIIPRVVQAYRYNPEIARHTSFDFPVDAGDQRAIESAQTSAYNEQLDSERFREIKAWFTKMELV